MEIISFGETFNQIDNQMLGKRRCNDCDCDDDCSNDCFDCGRYGYCDGDCGCDDEADCYYDD